MPRYDYRCRTCGGTFEVTRPMADATATAFCPAGHDDTVKLLTAVAVTGRATAMPTRQASSSAAGGCCGGACCS